MQMHAKYEFGRQHELLVVNKQRKTIKKKIQRHFKKKRIELRMLRTVFDNDSQ